MIALLHHTLPLRWSYRPGHYFHTAQCVKQEDLFGENQAQQHNRVGKSATT